jgi:hypothetical protein
MSEEMGQWDKRFGAAAYNRCWVLLEAEARSADDDADLLSAAFAQRFHWFRAGGDEQTVTAEWMVSRAAAALGSRARPRRPPGVGTGSTGEHERSRLPAPLMFRSFVTRAR